MSAASAAFLLGVAACLLCLLPLLLLFPALRWRATAALHTLVPARLGVGAMFSFFSRSAAPAAAPSSRAGEHHPGLRNTGNTCYLNSVLQSLASLPGLERFLLQLEADAEAEDVGTAVRDGLAEVLGALNSPLDRRTALLPSLLTRALSNHSSAVHSLVGAHAQQDAHELFVLLLDALESDARAVAAESEARRHAQRGLLALTAAEVGKGADSRASPSLMDGVPSANALPFRGLIAQRTACATCGYVEAIRHQEVDELSLSVSESRAAAGVGYGGISLEQCLQVWGALERIEWGCWRCSLVAEHERLRSDVARLEGELASAAPSTSASGKKATKATQRRRRLLREESTALALVTDALKSNAHEGDLSLPPTLKVPRVYSRCATKQVLLARPPPLLAIHLNRSDYSASSFGARKSSTPVGFGEWLDVAPFSTHGKLDVDPCRPLAPAQATRQKGLRHWYRLQSIVVHYGAHAFGHYVAYRRLPAAASQPHAADNWARISDDSVQRTSLREVLAQQDSVVLLFYARGDTLGDLVHDTSHVSVSSSTAGRKSAPASNGHSFAHASGAADDTQTRAQRSPSEESAYTPRVVHSWNSAAFLPAAGLQGLSGADVPTPGEDATMPRDAASSSLNGSVTPAPGERSQTRVRSSNGANGCQADANAAAHQQSANEPPLTSNLAGAKKVLVNGVSRAAKDVQEQSVGPD